MNKTHFAISILIFLSLSGCFSPEMPDHNIVSYSYYNIDKENYKVSEKICLDNDTEELIKYNISLDTLHRYLKHQNRDNYSDKYLSASTNFITIDSITEGTNNCYNYKSHISVQNQKNLSIVKLDMSYYKLLNNTQNRDLFQSENSMGVTFYSVCAYYAALEYVPNMPKVDSIFAKYILSKNTIKNNWKKLSYTIESDYSSTFSQEKLEQINKSYDIDLIKARFITSVNNHVPNSLGKLYDTTKTSFINLNSGRTNQYLDFTLNEVSPIYDKNTYLKDNTKSSYFIKVDYILEVPKKISIKKVYLTPTINSKLFDVYINDKLVISSTNYYIATTIQNQYKEKILKVTIKSKKSINSKEFENYFDELSKLPIRVGAYKRGGLKTIQQANLYTPLSKEVKK